jgi:hypothetical protein
MYGVELSKSKNPSLILELGCGCSLPHPVAQSNKLKPKPCTQTTEKPILRFDVVCAMCAQTIVRFNEKGLCEWLWKQRLPLTRRPDSAHSPTDLRSGAGRPANQVMGVELELKLTQIHVIKAK